MWRATEAAMPPASPSRSFSGAMSRPIADRMPRISARTARSPATSTGKLAPLGPRWGAAGHVARPPRPGQDVVGTQHRGELARIGFALRLGGRQLLLECFHLTTGHVDIRRQRNRLHRALEVEVAAIANRHSMQPSAF